MQTDVMIPPLFAVGNAALHVFETTRQRRLAMPFEYRHVNQEVGIRDGLTHAERQIVDGFLDVMRDKVLARAFLQQYMSQGRFAPTELDPAFKFDDSLADGSIFCLEKEARSNFTP